VNESVVDVVKRILVIAEAKVAVVIEPYFRGIEILDCHPLADIKFPTLDS
jgi:hypothetical protein